MKNADNSFGGGRSNLEAIVHNLNGPLTAIHGFAWLAQQYSLPPTALCHLGQIQAAADRLQRMVHGILTAADARAPQPIAWPGFWAICTDGLRAACARHSIRFDDRTDFAG